MEEHIDSHVLRKYEIIHRVGKGAYGVVWKAIDRKTKETVALKKIFQAFQNDTDSQRTYREIMFLQQMRHPNVVRLLNVMKADNDRDIYLVFEFLDTDLHQVIRSNILEKVHERYIMYQLFKGLKYLHSGELLHRDLKPSNLLLNADCVVKIADFGLARSLAPSQSSESGTVGASSGPSPVLTDYVATRWYRAPEILLGSTSYTKGVDMWSCGCILGEILGGVPMFPGTSTMNQLDRILELTGTPGPSDIAMIDSPFAQTMLESLPPARSKLGQLSERFPTASKDALDLLAQMLQFNPTKRISAEQALRHPYCAQFFTGSEMICERPITVPIDDCVKLSAVEYRDMLYTDIVKRKREQRIRQRRRHHQAGGGGM